MNHSCPAQVAGALVGAGGRGAAGASYVGDPRRWADYETLADRGDLERRHGFGSPKTTGGVVRSGRYALPFVAGEQVELAVQESEAEWVSHRDKVTGPALAKFLGLPAGDGRPPLRVALCGSQGSTRERNSQLQRLISRPFSTRFG